MALIRLQASAVSHVAARVRPADAPRRGGRGVAARSATAESPSGYRGPSTLLASRSPPAPASTAAVVSADVGEISLAVGRAGETSAEIASTSVDVAHVALTGTPGFMNAFSQSAPVKAYLRQLEASPQITKCWTSFTGFLLGDIIAQALTEPAFSLERSLILACYGFFLDAPAGNAFYTWLDARIEPNAPKSARAVASKIAIDQLLYAPVFTCVLYAYLTLAHGEGADAIVPTLQEKVLPTLIANWGLWPAAHGLNFYFVPTEQRILYNNFVAVLWTTYLSYIAH